MITDLKFMLFANGLPGELFVMDKPYALFIGSQLDLRHANGKSGYYRVWHVDRKDNHVPYVHANPLPKEEVEMQMIVQAPWHGTSGRYR